MHWYRCERISWGPFERGPVHMLWELHSNVDAPDPCYVGEWNSFRVLQALWIDDAEIAAYVNSTYGAVTKVAQFQDMDERTSTSQEVEWTWSVDGQPKSTIRYTQGNSTAYVAPIMERILWTSGNSVWMFNFMQERMFTNTQTYLTPGELHPPMLWSETGATTYVGRGVAYVSATLSASILKFSDLACTKPA